jgi:hypothetical protein
MIEHIPGETPVATLVRAVGLIVVVLHMAAAFAIIKRVWPECPPGGFAVATLLCACATAGEIELVARIVFKKDCYFFKLGDREAKFAIIGFGLAFALAGGLTIYEARDQHRADIEDARSRAMWDDYHEKMKAIPRMPNLDFSRRPATRAAGG